MALALTWVSVAAICGAAPNAISVGFEKSEGKALLDDAGTPCAELLGEARLTAEAKNGGGALELGGPDAKGVADFGKTFALSKQGSIELWCKPRALSGIIVGKYGAINIEFVTAEKCVRFGVKLKGGEKGTWVNCKSPKRSVKANEWVKIKSTWGAHGVLLFLNDALVGRATLPEAFQWFSESGRFVLGSYTWPPSYAVWFFDGLIDDFSFQPAQEPPPVAAKAAPAPKAAEEVAEATVLDLLLEKTPKPDYGATPPAMIRGHVVLDANGNSVQDADETGLPGVSISDGYSVVKTGPDGAYELTPSKYAVFVQIVRPAGHDVVGSWYQPVAASVDFCVKPARKSEEEYTFVQVTDSHVSTDRRSLQGVSDFVREVNALNPPPRFVFNTGDLVNLDKQLKASDQQGRAYFNNYAGLMNHLDMPYYNVAGDHTDSGYRLADFASDDHRRAKAMFWEYFGPNFFSFEYGRVHFVSVDNVYHTGEKKSHQFIPEHLAWMEQDMANRGAGSVVVTGSEKSLDLAMSGLADLGRKHHIALQLVGDDHIVSYSEDPLPTRVGGSLSGVWWNGPCADLSPKGYMVYQVRGTELTCFYKGLYERVAFVTPTYGSKSPERSRSVRTSFSRRMGTRWSTRSTAGTGSP